MKCPFCAYPESKVVDSRPSDEGSSIRRRRECLSCSRRFTTYETVEFAPIMVVKKDGRRQSFDRRKILNGMLRACEKRPVSLDTLEGIVNRIEQDLQSSMEHEIQSEALGEIVMRHLRKLDQVAYVRFASVYRQFQDIGSFMRELNTLMDDDSQSTGHS
ncbi:MAG: transcriptional repressor NrdR [Oscillibacter sp.]|nr:transcriptional repressor NrdR [Oscillibacter sp.]